MAFSYYASRLSENIGKTPEGYLVCRDVVIARTGWQQYAVRELPAEALPELGIDGSNPDAMVDVYRPAEEVFSEATIASFEGKSITDGHPPMGQFVGPDNVDRYEFGHVQNVRKGEEPLESGEWPLLADLIVKRDPLIGKVEAAAMREVSCGYDYVLASDGERIIQTSIRGNHVAVVPRGRAGAEARIIDSATEPQERKPAGGSTGTSHQKEKKPMSWKRIFGLGLKALAADAETTPEQLAEAAEQGVEEKKKAKDAEPEPVKTEPEKKEPEKGKDADDRRKRLHDALDRMLGKDEPEPEVLPVGGEGAGSGEDADIEELRSLLDEFLSEEADEPQHARPVGDAARAGDQFIEPIEEEEVIETPKTNDTAEMLKALRPLVARSGDAKLKAAFNAQVAKLNAGGRAARDGNGGYGAFAGAARQHRAGDAQKTPDEDRNAKIQDRYNKARTGEEVK